MARVYATAEQYAEFAEQPFAGDAGLLPKRLRAASVEVDKLTRLAIFPVTDAGLPSDAADAEAFADATCAIVEYWENTDDPWGIDAAQGAVKIGSVSIGTTSSSADSLSAADKLRRRIGDQAVDILLNARLLSTAVSHS